jgi:hypothetical protein
MGTAAQMGAGDWRKLDIYDFSTPEDRQILADAFAKGQNQKWVNALSKMKPVGYCSITGTLAYGRQLHPPDEHSNQEKNRVVTNRQIGVGETFFNTPLRSFNLTAGEFELKDTDKRKSTGLVYPAAQLIIDKQGQLHIDLSENPGNSWTFSIGKEPLA